MRGVVTGIVLVLTLGILFPYPASAGRILGSLQGPLGGYLGESYVWTVGSGANAADAEGTGWQYGSSYVIPEDPPYLPGGIYNMCANAHGGLRHAFEYGVSVPSVGDVNVDIRHTGAMSAPGFTWLAPCSEAGQTFVANGRSLWTVTALAATGGVNVQMTVHRGGPGGPQVGTKTKGMGSLYPSFFHWSQGEVPLEPGEIYYIRMVRVDGPTWLPCVSKDWDPYPNGIAYINGDPYPQYDLDLGITCADDGHIYDVDVSSGWRTDQQNEVRQTFVALGEELRYAQFHLAQGEGMMRVSVHEHPVGTQIGPTKRKDMDTYVSGPAIWGPGEVPLTPGATYYVRLVRDDGGLFGIYGTENNYPDGELYLDGSPSGVDAECTFISKEIDLPDISITNVQVTGITGQTATITWNTSVGASSYVQYWTGDPYEMLKNISEHQDTLTTNHSVELTGLERDTTYKYRVYSWRTGYDLASSAEDQFTTPSSTGTITGTITASGGGILAEAKIMVAPGGFEAESNGSGVYSVVVPTGTFQVTASHFGYEDAVASGVAVTSGGTTVQDLELTSVTNLLTNGGFESDLTGWTEYGVFDQAFADGSYAVPSRTGTKWAGSVGNHDPKTGGIYQTVTVNPLEVYTVRGYLFTSGFDEGQPSHGHAQGRMGYDPSGGADPSAPTVAWTNWAFTAERWMEMELTATAPGGQLTVFLETRYNDYWLGYLGLDWFKVGFDDVSVHEQVNVTTGTIGGTVIAYSTSLPIEEALIEVLGTARYAYTDEFGQYSIPGIDPGLYNVRATKAGYDQLTKNNQQVNVGEITVVDFSLTGEGLPYELVNPSFETGDMTGWTWHEFDGGPPDGVFGPGAFYGGITPYHGDKAFGVASHWLRKTGALYQKIAALKGNDYTARCWIQTYEYPAPSPGDERVRARIGISPTGSTDPTSGVVWSAQYASIGSWTQISIPHVYVNTTEVTVFCEVIYPGGIEWEVCAMDYFELSPDSGIPSPTPTPTATPGIPGDNLLVNPGAEYGDFTAWTTGGTPGYMPVVDPWSYIPSPDNHSGDHRFGIAVGWEPANLYQYQAISVSPGTQYTTSLWACHEDGTNEHIQFSWIDGSFGGAENVLYDIGPGGNGTAWVEYSGQIFVPTSPTVTIVVRYLDLYGSGIAGIHVDDMFVGAFQVAETATPTPTNTPANTPTDTPTPPASGIRPSLWSY